MNAKQRAAHWLAVNREHYQTLALRWIADDSRDGAQQSGTITCPACHGVMHYTNSPPLGKAMGSCTKNECLSVIGPLPARDPLPPPRRVSLRSKGEVHYYVALNGSAWRIHDRASPKQVVPVGDASATDRVFVARNRDQRVYRFRTDDYRSLILAHIERQFLEAVDTNKGRPVRMIDVDPAGEFPSM